MFKPIRTTHQAIKIMNNSLIDLPAPVNISIWWNYGSLLGLCMVIQIITGLFLAMHYIPNTELAFYSVMHISRDVNNGWLLRAIHANGASLFFLFIYLHMSRSIYYNSFYMMETWNIGMMLLIMTMATAFMGYVLPWGQMSFWGATVITNIFSAIPYLGQTLVEWIWGGYAVDNPTLNRFYAIHFIIPFMMIGATMAHLLFLHSSGSNNPLGISSNSDRIPFHSYFSTKDILGFTVTMSLFLTLVTLNPNLFMDPENFLLANSLVTPIHIQPEWYFLWLYAILRSIPNKLGGVLALVAGLLMPLMLPLTMNNNKLSWPFYPFHQTMFWLFFISPWLILTWIGSCPVEEPYIMTGQTASCMYFTYFILCPVMSHLSDNLNN